MPAEAIATIVAGSLLISLSILLQVHLWQRKEYRWDRMRSFLTTPEHKPMRDWWLLVFAIAVVLGWVNMNEATAELLGWVALGAYTLHHGRLLIRFGLFRPQPTIKGLIAVGASSVFSIGLLWLLVRGNTALSLEIATVLLLLPLGVAAAVAGTNGVSLWRKRTIIAEAAAEIAKINPTVIAITGSVGKTSVKEFTAHIIRTSGKHVVATKEHRNSEFTVAQDIIEQLSSRSDVYIVEAAAYRKGEVAAIARLVTPRIAIVTAITNQHEGLFGSIDDIALAKWELVDALPPNGTAVLNADDARIMEHSIEFKGNSLTYSVHKPVDVYASNIVLEPHQISCTVHIKKVSDHVTLPLVGRGALSGALAAATAAYTAGVAPNDIFQALSTLPALPRTMHLHTLANGITVLDDSYSASEASVKNAVEHFQIFAQPDKHIVLVPIIELSRSAEKVHEHIGRILAATNAKVYVFGRAYEEALRRGAGTAAKFQWFENPRLLAQQLVKNVSPQSAVLLEGRIPETVKRVLHIKRP